MTPSSPLVVPFDRRQLIGMAWAGLFFVILSVLMLVYADDLYEMEHPLLIRATGLFILIVLVPPWLIALRYVAYFGPALVLDAQGIVDSVSLARLGRIPWSNIAGFRSGSLTGNPLLVIRLRDARQVSRGAWPWMRLLYWACARRYGSPVVVPVMILKVTATDLLKICRRFRAEAKKAARLSQASSEPRG